MKDKIKDFTSNLNLIRKLEKNRTTNSWCSSGSWLKKILILFILFSFAVPIFAQSALPWWLSLEYGKQRFRSGDFGAALMLFEDARRSRHNMYERMERDFIALLSVGEVRRLGDALDRVEQFSRERYFTAASAALDELFYRVPRASLNNSANAALEAFGRLKNYPEAEYWIGEVYRVEGELPLALAQYNRAYSMRAVLEDPGFANSLKYRIAGIHRVRHEFGEMENILLMIINNEDPLWFNSNRGDENRTNVSLPFAEASASFARSGMTRILLAEGIDRFLEIYRYNNGVVEQAHRQLGFFYINNGQPSALPHLMFAFLIQNTVIIEELRRRQFDFVYTDLETLIEEVNKNPLLLSYINEVEYFKTAYYLAAALFRNQNTSSEMRIWSFLSTLPQAGEWHQRAVMQLRNPRSEPVLERL